MPTTPPPLPDLPICEVLADISQHLTQRHELVLEAPPGAGKTTLVPLHLFQQPWLKNQKIVMLEPRRMAAKAAATRMAMLLGEQVGSTVGYRVRQESRISNTTRIEVITEGVLNRMLLDDPSLADIGLLIFDEFHERSLDADTGLALALEGRALFREADNPLKILVMSATLDGDSISTLLAPDDSHKAPVIKSDGRMFPVEIYYGQAKRFGDNVVDLVASCLLDISSRHDHSILVFLPGQAEINRVIQRLQNSLAASELQRSLLLPLYGNLSLQQQQQAIDPLPTNSPHRKIVFATDIAQTSLTIEGVHVVVDAGLCRQARFDPNTAMTRLHTQGISKDASIQRAGRAGRLAPGYCYRLWSEQQQQQLPQQTSAEILQADLTPLALQLLAWGVNEPNDLRWLNSPPKGAMQQALQLLHRLAAIELKSPADTQASTQHPPFKQWKLTHTGQLMSSLPCHPRLAYMLVCAARHQQADIGCALAALLSERNPLQHNDANLSSSLFVIMGELPCPKQHRAWRQRVKKLADNFNRVLKKITVTNQANIKKPSIHHADTAGFLLACAYPDRIAKRRSNNSNTANSPTQFQLSNGRNALLNTEQGSSLLNSHWIVIADMGGHRDNSSDKIFSACDLSPTLFSGPLATLLTTKDQLHWDENTQRFSAEHICSVGKIIFSRKPIATISAEAKQQALLAMIEKSGLDLLPWSPQLRQWQARVMLLHTLNEQTSPSDNPWPNISNQQLLSTLASWLGPYLGPINKLQDFSKLHLTSILANLLPWPLPEQLNQLAPQTLTVPSGSNISIDYCQQPPVLSVKLQEMFGCKNTPTIANGKVQLVVHLLSPARRPLQVTQDLASFWKNSYFDVKKEMKGRYPKHPWPDDPLTALATRHSKRRK